MDTAILIAPVMLVPCTYTNRCWIEKYHFGVFRQVMDGLSMKWIDTILRVRVSLDPIHCIYPANCIREQFFPAHFSC